MRTCPKADSVKESRLAHLLSDLDRNCKCAVTNRHFLFNLLMTCSEVFHNNVSNANQKPVLMT